MPKIENLKTGSLGLITETEDGRIMQVGLTDEQSKLLQMFMGSISQESALIQLPEEYDLVLKNK